MNKASLKGTLNLRPSSCFCTSFGGWDFCWFASISQHEIALRLDAPNQPVKTSKVQQRSFNFIPFTNFAEFNPNCSFPTTFRRETGPKKNSTNLSPYKPYNIHEKWNEVAWVRLELLPTIRSHGYHKRYEPDTNDSSYHCLDKGPFQHSFPWLKFPQTVS